ncbi:MAG TPA: hypothetical protein DFR83_06405 [Deltaproteobacteria bacterium]|nr:hypothetical protein [Deltaproteobacteria bacterium]
MPEHKPRPLQRDGPDRRLDLPSRQQTEDDLDSLRGNGFLQEQLAKRLNGEWGNGDSRLGRARTQLNDDDLTTADRARTLLRYRNGLLPSLDARSMLRMRDNDSSMPVYGGGDNPGMVQPLYEHLGRDGDQQAIMGDLCDRILAQDASELNIEEIWEGTRDRARDGGDLGRSGADSDLAALRAMATLANYYKIARDGDGQAQLPEGVSEELWSRIDAAGTALATSTSAEASVMSRGVAPKHNPGEDFTSDRNFHFFSHAYLAASLQHEHGVAPGRAQATSGFIGAQYELLPSSFGENSGNAGLKDILVNAEGAAFGSSLMRDAGTELPAMSDGPALEDRSWEDLGEFDAETQALLDKAGDLSVQGIIRSIW